MEAKCYSEILFFSFQIFYKRSYIYGNSRALRKCQGPVPVPILQIGNQKFKQIFSNQFEVLNAISFEVSD